MHFLLSWEIRVKGEDRARIRAALKACLKGYSWIRPLTPVYIVRIKSFQDYNSIREKLLAVVKDNPKAAYFIISPVMPGNRYRGWLPKKLWPKIEERTK